MLLKSYMNYVMVLILKTYSDPSVKSSQDTLSVVDFEETGICKFRFH